MTAPRYLPDFESGSRPTAKTHPPCKECNVPAATRRRIAERSRPQPDELRPGDDSVLLPGQCRDRLPTPRWLGFGAFFATYPNHLVRVAGWVLRMGDECD
jgi:hypothetical protein